MPGRRLRHPEIILCVIVLIILLVISLYGGTGSVSSRDLGVCRAAQLLSLCTSLGPESIRVSLQTHCAPVRPHAVDDDVIVVLLRHYSAVGRGDRSGADHLPLCLRIMQTHGIVFSQRIMASAREVIEAPKSSSPKSPATPHSSAVKTVNLANSYDADFQKGATVAYSPNSVQVSPSDTIVIVGAGPTGLCAAVRLEELGHTNWQLYEGKEKASGLAQSIKDDQGFTWDVGVHIGFSHFRFFDALLDRTLPSTEWVNQTRSSPIYMEERVIGYPLQHYFWQLHNETTAAVVESLKREVDGIDVNVPTRNFEEWVRLRYGSALSEIFMLPYNAKVWAHPPKELNTVWVGERVAPLNVQKILENVAARRVFKGWGPNARFRYPRLGTGQVWEAVAESLPAQKLHLNSLVSELEVQRTGAGASPTVRVHVSGTRTGRKEIESKKHAASDEADTRTFVDAKAVLSTMPLDHLVASVTFRPQGGALHAADVVARSLSSPSSEALLRESPDGTQRFKHTKLHLVGIGIKGSPTSFVEGNHWMYFPEEKYPFYRMTLMSLLSPALCPAGHYSLMFEVSESIHRPFKWASPQDLTNDIISVIHSVGILNSPSDVVSTFYHFEYRGYPVPYVERDMHVHDLDNLLRPAGAIWSRGRFGSWKYEISNQDHSCMLGVEAVDSMLFNSTELTFVNPNVVNAEYSALPRRHFRGHRTSSVSMRDNRYDV